MAFDKQTLIDAENECHVKNLARIERFTDFYNEHKTGEKHCGMNIFKIDGKSYLMVSFDAIFSYTMVFRPLQVGPDYTFTA